MRALIIGDQSRLMAQIRAILLRCGYDCSDTDLIPLQSGAENAGQVRYDLAILVLSSDPVASLSVLRNVRNVTQTDILAVGPASDAKLVLRTLREGADEYVADEDVDTELESAVLQLKTKHAPESTHGRIVAIVAPSGGSGASTLSANLAVALAAQHGRVALTEIPHSQGDQQLLFDLQPAHNLAELCRNLHRLDRSMFQQSLAAHSSGVHLLAATSDNSGHLITPQGVRQALAFSRALFPYVVVDVDRVLARQQVAVLLQADLILFAMRLDLLSLNSTRRMLTQMEQLGIAENAIRVIVNRFRQPHELAYRKVEQALGVQLLHYVPNDPAALNAAISRGVPTVLDCPRSKYARSIGQLAKLVDRTCEQSFTSHANVSEHPRELTGVLRDTDYHAPLPGLGTPRVSMAPGG